MTRAEAIKWLEDCTAVLDMPYTPCPGNESSAVAAENWEKATTRYRELYRMAIAALKEQESLAEKTSDNKASDKKQATSKWISTNDAYPDEGVKVLGYSADSGNYCVGNYCKRWDKWRAAGSPKVTHWMYLPEPPKEG
jgi:hypothetical protein